MRVKNLVLILIVMLSFAGLIFIPACSSEDSSGDTEVVTPENGDDSESSEVSYQSVTGIGMTFEWRPTQDTKLEIKLSAPTTGWLGLGFSSNGSRMTGANLISGFVDDTTEEVTIEDGHASSATGRSVDTTSHVTTISGTQSDNSTQVHFVIPLDSGDAQDYALTIGQSVTLLLAYRDDDDLSKQHSKRKKLTITKL